MIKIVILKLGEGSFEQGFPVILQIGKDGFSPTIEVPGKLPPATHLPLDYSHWKQAYRQIELPSRLEPKTGFISNVSYRENCIHTAQILINHFNEWLNSSSFRTLREKLLEQLMPSDEIRILLQTKDIEIQRLPWHLWDLLERYPKAEIAYFTPIYERLDRPIFRKNKVRILAILGNSNGINIQTDYLLLNQLPESEVTFLVEPSHQEFNENLWDIKGWDILFFAGHSSSQNQGTTGTIFINKTERLTILQLKNALKKAIERGLKIAFFNSCDGLGLAQELMDLQIPQILVMREPIPDLVAQEFLKYFLAAFSRGESLYLSLREAREKLQGLESEFPCATWLPVLYQHPAEIPPTWQTLNLQKFPSRLNLRSIFLASITITTLILGVRHLGLFQPLELKALDQLMQLRSREVLDSRILIVTITEADIGAQNPEHRRGSLGDVYLYQLLQELETYKPRVIGLDIYRDFPVEKTQPNLAKYLQQQKHLITVCKVSDSQMSDAGISPPPEVPNERLGFSDFVVDSDGIIRRHLFALTPEPTSPCLASYALNLQLVFRYLAAEGIFPQWTKEGNLQLGKVTFKSLETPTGGYQKLDAWGHQILLNYRTSKQAFTQVTLTDVLQKRVDPKMISGRVIIIGTIAPSFGDYWQTPYRQSPGVLMQAQMTSQILSAVLDQRPLLWTLPQWGEAFWIGFWGFIGAIIAWRLGLSPKLVVSIVIVEVSLGVVCWILLTHQGCWLPFVPSVFAVIVTGSVVVIYDRLQQRKLQ